MPCRDYDDADTIRQQVSDLQKKERSISFLEALACAALEVIARHTPEGDPLDHLDFKEAGLKKEEVLAWLTEHQKKDAIRRETEAHLEQIRLERAEKARLREAAMTKVIDTLSNDELRALGLPTKVES